MNRQSAIQSKYDKVHCRRCNIKLNKETDKDILDLLDSLDNKQGFIKSLIRDYIKNANNIKQ